ncbi:MAG: hypothetical protein ACI8ZN_000593 [Bacteroidia bacterium]|jgi:hypothetical protein
MNKPMKTQLKTRWGSALNATVAFLFVGAIIFTLPACGGDDPKPTPDGGTTIEEYLIIDGKRYEGKDFVKKSIVANNRTDQLRIILVNSTYPYVDIEHERAGDSIPLRIYTPSDAADFFPDVDSYEVGFTSADGAKPVYCQFLSIYEPPTPHGKYEIKKVNGKILSEFGKVYMSCEAGGNGTDTRVVEGRVIWEEK